jgi:hypothetical protein
MFSLNPNEKSTDVYKRLTLSSEVTARRCPLLKSRSHLGLPICQTSGVPLAECHTRIISIEFGFRR